ncbi:MAG: 2OG-Fe(II) oxygenase [Nitrospira sp.]|nr:2OG-Fe(II) oxygenase [Nitrospira sp.]MCA9481321.1 2OG-Fe(II) oxygenase [Nitrospira sp.]
MDKVMDYVYVTNVIPPHVCESVLAEIRPQEWTKHSWYNYEDNQYSSQKDKELDVLSTNQKLQDTLGPFVFKALQEYMVKYGNQTDDRIKSFVRTFTPIRFNRYRTGTMMREHYDHIHSIFDGQRKGIPILTILGSLNDGYEGGDFWMTGLQKVNMRAGDIVLFPSNFMYPHEVKEVTKGERYTFVAWAF